MNSRAIKKLVFSGSKKYEPNTFIGGVANTITSASEIANILNIPVSGIKAFSVVGDDIQFHVKDGYEIPQSAFRDNEDITYYRDEGGKCFGIGEGAFMGASELEEFKGLAVIWVGYEAGAGTNNGPFRDCVKLKKFITSKAWINCNRAAFSGCTLLEEIDFSSVYIIRDNGIGIFNGCKNLPPIIINPLYAGSLGSFFAGAVVSGLNLNNVSVLDNVFFGNQNNRATVLFETLYSEQVTALGHLAINNVLGDLKVVNFPNCTSVGNFCFDSSETIEEIYLPKAETFIGSSNFGNMTSLSILDLRGCKELLSFNMINNIPATAELRIHEEIDVNNINITYAQSRGVTINLYDDNGDYVSTL